MVATFDQYLPLVLFAGFVVLSVRYLRLGRGDRRAAIRFGGFLAIVGVLHWLAGAPHLFWSAEPMWAVGDGVGRALFLGLFGTVAYLALEPIIRKQWPSILVTSTRVLEGRWRDPLIGRDVLLGLTASALLQVLALFSALLDAIAGMSFPMRFSALENVTSGPWRGIAVVLQVIPTGPVTMLQFTAVFAVLVALLRRRALAVGITVVLFAVLFTRFWGFDSLILTFGLAAATAILGVVLMIKGGLLAAATYATTALLFVVVPVTFSFDAWYARLAPPALIFVGALAVYGYLAATGRFEASRHRPRLSTPTP